MAEESKTKRLCTEIQLFDLCSKDKCTSKDGRFCGNAEMLAKFEAISEEDEKDLNQFIADEEDELESSEYDEYDDERFGVSDDENEDEDEYEDE